MESVSKQRRTRKKFARRAMRAHSKVEISLWYTEVVQLFAARPRRPPSTHEHARKSSIGLPYSCLIGRVLAIPRAACSSNTRLMMSAPIRRARTAAALSSSGDISTPSPGVPASKSESQKWQEGVADVVHFVGCQAEATDGARLRLLVVARLLCTTDGPFLTRMLVRVRLL